MSTKPPLPSASTPRPALPPSTPSRQSASTPSNPSASTSSHSAAADADTHVHAIARLGYSEREARFLSTVASAGGYFLRRQFLAAMAVSRGRTDADFTRRLLARRHATVRTFCLSTQVIHLCAAAFYDGDREASISARRTRPALVIKGRLMALDLALARTDVRFVVGEAARLRLCTGLGIDQSCVPCREYHPHSTPTPVTRYLPDASLVGVASGSPHGTRPTLVLGYADEGAQTAAGLRTFLRRHMPLLSAARAWRVLYACESPRQASVATRTFLQVLGTDAASDAALFAADLREYRDLRERYDAKRWADLDAARITRYFELKDALGPTADVLFRRWQAEGDAALAAPDITPTTTLLDRFDPVVLPHSYAAIEAVRGLA